ncbi:MAG: GAF domain-containing protein [Deltaproteobacteria bacterium]|nr:GAF domain-containing protein [Deltaproteobacteria bacterium]
MKINRKIILAVFVPVLLAMAVGSALVYSYLILEKAQANGDKVRLIRNSFTELNHLVFSYVNYREERPERQFLAEYEKLTGLMAGTSFRNPAQQQLVDDIRLNSQAMKDAFLRLVSNPDFAQPTAGNQALDESAERLVGQLLIRSHKADSIASTLRNLVDQDIRKTQTRTLTFIALVLILTALVFSLILFRTGRGIISSLTKLHRGTEVIGSGNLDFFIAEDKNDEIGELAQAFNRMTARLKEVTASKADLEREMAEREKAETEIRASRKFLEIANRHTDLDGLLQGFVKEIKEFTGCAAVGIRLLDLEGNIPYLAYQGFSRRFYETESPLSIKTDHCMCINVVQGTTDPGLSFYTEGGSFYMNGTTRFLATVSEADKGQTRNVCNQTGYESVALIPIRSGPDIRGLIHLADPQENRVPLDRVTLLERAAAVLGNGIQRILAEALLKKAHAELEIKVAERTEELTAEIRQRQLIEEALRESEGELRYLSSQILVAQEKERKEIAEDLHDHTWQILNTIKLDIDQLLSPEMTANRPAARQLGKRIIANIRAAVERIRTMQGDLWPPVMDDIGLLATINWYGREFEQGHPGMTVVKQIEVTEEDVPDHLKIVIYRIMQETLKNAAQHSSADRIRLSLKKDGPRIECAIADNGQGFDLERILYRAGPWAGFGLIGLKERTEQSGGTLDIRSGEGSGTILQASWSLNGTEQKTPDRRPISSILKQEEPFRMVTETISDWVYSMSVKPNGQFICDWITPGFALVTGHSADADLTEIVHPEDQAVLEERFRHIQALQPYAGEYRIVTKNGEACWIRDSINPVADPLHPGTIRVVGAAQNITGHKRMEAERIRQKVILEGINSIFQEALVSHTDEDLGRVCLTVAEEISQSRFGFIDEIGPDGLLHSIAISNPGWEQCTLVDKSGHLRLPSNLKIHGLYGRVLLDGKSLLTNTPAEHPDSIGTPPGHPPLKAFLGVPLIRDERTIGLIAVGNREGGYGPSELEALEALAPAIVQAFSHRRSETEIQRQVEELTRFNRAAVDRELRMIELKKQINALCAQAGQPRRYPLEMDAGREES